MSGFELRAYRPGDEETVVAMFQRIFGEGYTEELWRWKYAEGPYARPELSVIATGPDGQVLGHGAVFCQPLNLIGRRKGSGQVTDLMIDPTQQKTGVGSAIYVRCAERIAQAGFPVCLAFPNERSAVGLHWHAAHVAIMEKYVLPIGDSAHDRLRELVEAEPEDERLDLTWAPEYDLDEGVDDLFASVAATESLSIWKDREYLAWRYGAHPEPGRYRFSALLYGDMLMGLVVLKPERKRLRILDLLVRDKRIPIARRLLLHVADACGAETESVRFTGRDPWFFAEAFAGFDRAPAFSHHVFSRAVDREQAFLYENPLNWTCTLGDCDSV